MGVTTVLEWFKLVGLLLATANASTTPDTVVAWSDAIALAVDTVVDEVMQTTTMQQIINEQPYTEIHVDGSVSTASAAAQIARLFNQMKHVASDVALNVETLTSDGVGSQSPTFTVDASYSQFSEFVFEEEKYFVNVSYTNSAYKTARLNSDAAAQQQDLDMVSHLTPVYQQLSSVSGAGFQYFGTPSGVLSVFPGHEWASSEDGSGYTDYDPRLSAWYARTVSGPKNVVLLLDISSADALGRVQLAARSVLSTLSLDDYVALITFDSTGAEALGDGCFQDSSNSLMLARASSVNVRLLQDAVAGVSVTGGGGGADAAFELAFDALERGVGGGVGAAASCESMVLLLSAGESSGDSGRVASMNTVNARVFSYGLGSVSGNSAYLREVACGGSGVFTLSPDDDAAAAVGLYYIHILQYDEQPWFSYGGGLRPDLLANGDDSNGAISHFTVTRAAWDRSTSPPTLLGVAAADFDMWDLKNMMEAQRFQQSFPLMVNNEGDTLFHPLQTVYKQKHLYDVGRDISNYENFPGWNEAVRAGLLSGSVGEATLTVERAIEKGDSVFEGVDTSTLVTTYFWQKVPDLPFFVAFAYTAEDLVQRSLQPDRYGNDWLLYHDLEQLSQDSMKDIIPDLFTASLNPEVGHLFPDGVQPLSYNADNCPDVVTGEIWGNCVEDQYCIDNGLACNGTCVCHPHRWPVGRISTSWPSTMYAPNCWKDSSAAFDVVATDASARAVQSFINREKFATNMEPVLKDKCILAGDIAAKFAPYVSEAAAAGKHARTVWSYLGHSDGIILPYPGVYFGTGYDPTRRPWYSRAIAYKGVFEHVISTPYNDAAGAGLMNTFTQAVWQEQVLDPTAENYLEITNDRVFGVHGWDMLYPDINGYAPLKTADIAGGCSLNDVYNQTASDSQPVCFLMDPSGLLLTHPDFLVSAEEASKLTTQLVGGEVGAWPIENVFIGKKEPPLAQAMVDAGFLVAYNEVVNEDTTKLLSWFQVDLSALPDSGVLGGTIASSNGCLLDGAQWQVAHVARSNVFLVVVDGYERLADLSSCSSYEAEAVVDIEFDTCAFTTGAAERVTGQLSCPAHEKRSTVQLEAVRLDYAKCAREQFVSADGTLGSLVTAVTAVFMVFTAMLAGAIYTYRNRYVMRVASPFFSVLMCCGALIGFGLQLSLIGEPTDGMCVLRNWLAGFAFVFLYAPLLAKTWRVHKIFTNRALRKLKLRNADLLQSIGMLALVEGVILLLWTAVEPPKRTLKVDDVDPLLATVECDSDNFETWALLQICFSFVIVLGGVWLSYETRNVSGEFNESSQIGITIYNMFFMGLIIVPMVYGLDVDYEARFVLATVGILAVCSVTLLVLFVPKFVNLNKTKADFPSTTQHHSTANNNGKKGKSGVDTTGGGDEKGGSEDRNPAKVAPSPPSDGGGGGAVGGVTTSEEEEGKS